MIKIFIEFGSLPLSLFGYFPLEAGILVKSTLILAAFVVVTVKLVLLQKLLKLIQFFVNV